MAQEITFTLFRTYLKTIENSVGANTFRNSYARTEEGEEVDILRDGVRSCAFFVSSVLKMYDLVKTQHATVRGLVADLEGSGWGRIAEPRVGAILLWDPLPDPHGEAREHIGFYVGEEEAISNSSRSRSPERHHYTYGIERPATIRAIYWKDGLDTKVAHVQARK